MDETITPFEASLSFAVKLDKDDFIGKKALVRHTEPARTRIGIKVTGKGIARGGEDVFMAGTGKLVGKTTSGTFCPHLKEALAMAIVGMEAAGLGTPLEVDVRGRRIDAQTVALPFYKRA
jgi:aminomethyltransferase